MSLKQQILATMPAQPAVFGLKADNKQYDLAVVLGRFEPLHVGHLILLNKAFMVADKVLVLVGSSKQPRTIKNPFTFAEREEMIIKSVAEQSEHLKVRPLVDNLYSDDEWMKQVRFEIKSDLAATHQWTDRDIESISKRKVAIVGNKKDESSYYLDLFPEYDYVAIDEVKLGFDATSVREILFEKPGFIEILKSLLPEYTFEFMKNFVHTEEYRRLHREYMMVKKYKESWSVAPYAPTFITVDAVVKKAGHILMVRRKEAPGEGLLALPGGFINANERIQDAAMRELAEETKIDLPPGLLRNSMGTGVVFDHPGRSLRGRTVTHAFLFDLDKADKKSGLPKVKGSDDAAEALWIPVDELIQKSDQIYEDHLSIIRSILGV
jgi:bifunctional NMN adenylyltransferase/nudix hydrolase